MTYLGALALSLGVTFCVAQIAAFGALPLTRDPDDGEIKIFFFLLFVTWIVIFVLLCKHCVGIGPPPSAVGIEVQFLLHRRAT